MSWRKHAIAITALLITIFVITYPIGLLLHGWALLINLPLGFFCGRVFAKWAIARSKRRRPYSMFPGDQN